MIVIVVAGLGVATTLVMWRLSRSHPGGAWARPLLWGALLAAVAAAVAVWPTAWRDAGTFTFLLLGVPVVLAAASLGIPEQARWRRAGVWVSALLLLGWSLLLGLGVGLVFVPAALLLLAAAGTAPNSRQPLRGQRSVRPAR